MTFTSRLATICRNGQDRGALPVGALFGCVPNSGGNRWRLIFDSFRCILWKNSLMQLYNGSRVYRFLGGKCHVRQETSVIRNVE